MSSLKKEVASFELKKASCELEKKAPSSKRQVASVELKKISVKCKKNE